MEKLLKMSNLGFSICKVKKPISGHNQTFLIWFKKAFNGKAE